MMAQTKRFFNEDVAGPLRIQEPYEKVKVHVLNDFVEIFELTPVTVKIDSVDGQLCKEIRVRNYPRKSLETTE